MATEQHKTRLPAPSLWVLRIAVAVFLVGTVYSQLTWPDQNPLLTPVWLILGYALYGLGKWGIAWLNRGPMKHGEGLYLMSDDRAIPRRKLWAIRAILWPTIPISAVVPGLIWYWVTLRVISHQVS